MNFKYYFVVATIISNAPFLNACLFRKKIQKAVSCNSQVCALPQLLKNGQGIVHYGIFQAKTPDINELRDTGTLWEKCPVEILSEIVDPYLEPATLQISVRDNIAFKSPEAISRFVDLLSKRGDIVHAIIEGICYFDLGQEAWQSFIDALQKNHIETLTLYIDDNTPDKYLCCNEDHIYKWMQTSSFIFDSLQQLSSLKTLSIKGYSNAAARLLTLAKCLKKTCLHIESLEVFADTSFFMPCTPEIFYDLSLPDLHSFKSSVYFDEEWGRKEILTLFPQVRWFEFFGTISKVYMPIGTNVISSTPEYTTYATVASILQLSGRLLYNKKYIIYRHHDDACETCKELFTLNQIEQPQ